MTRVDRRRWSAALPLAALVPAALAALWLGATLGSAGVGQIVVDSTGDEPNATPGDATCDTASGGCTLRAAIDAANSTPGLDTIAFDIPGDGPHTIRPQTPLPALTESVVIDGYTQPGAGFNTLGPKEGTNAVLMIEIDGSAAGEDADGIVVAGGDNIIQGLVINRFGGSGIVLRDNLGATMNDANYVQGNFLGTDVSGEVALGNGVGVTVENSWSNIIGDIARSENNLISGNGVGIIFTGDSMDNHVRNSIIGAARDGQTPLPNQSHGVLLRDGALCNTIGAEFPPQVGENIIAYNGGDAVSMEDGTGINNYVDPNEIHSNGGLGIDLNNDGVTPNDTDDLDSGPNDLQNFPVITTVTLHESGALTIEGVLDSTPNTFMNLFFFLNDECDPSGYGEGLIFLGSHQFNSGPTGDYEFSVMLSADAQLGQAVTASVSSPSSTSEFSPCVAIDEGERTQGDFNCDSSVNAADAVILLRHAAGAGEPVPGCPPIGSAVTAAQPAGDVILFGDVDCSGAVEPVDALKLLQHIAGLGYEAPAPCPAIGDPL